MKKAILLPASLAAASLAVLGLALISAPGAGTAFTGTAFAAPPPVADALVGSRVDDFQLIDQTRTAYRLKYFGDAKAVVIMSQQNGDKSGAAKALKEIKAAYAGKGVEVFMLNSTAAAPAIATEAKAQGFDDMAVLVDELQLVGDALGVTRANEVFVINPKTWTVAYHGPIDDRFGASAKKTASKAYLRDALDALTAGNDVAVATAPLGGAKIAFADRSKKGEFAKISYAKDVAPVLLEKCASCHTKGGIGPFAMSDYNVVKSFAPMIRESIRTDRMPPFNADEKVGHWKDDNSLTDKEIKTIVHWVEAGAQRGAGEDYLAKNLKDAPEWPLGKPDLILEIPAFAVKADGIIDYQTPCVANPLKEAKWLRASTILPGERSVVHHVLSSYIKQAPKADGSGCPAFGAGGGTSIGSYTPGAAPQILPLDVGSEIPAGGGFSFQMHYTTSGKPVSDVTRVGLYFYDKPPTYIKHSTVIADATINLKPELADQKTVAYTVFPKDALLYTAFPHAHYRGVRASLEAIYPDGKHELLLDLPRYDFNWQRDYDFATPKMIPAGTKMVARFTYDNSVRNKANPNPADTVTWGEQTMNEMHYLRLNYRWMDETKDNRVNYDGQMMQSMMIGMVDDNLNGKIDPEEQAAMGGAMRAFGAMRNAAGGQVDPLGVQMPAQKPAGQ